MTRNQKRALENFSAQLAEKYYTAQEAQKRLGMNRDMFNYYVKQGAIQRENLIGSHGYYPKEAINMLAEKLEYTLLVADTPILEFRKATFNDLEDISRMAYLNFGELSRSPERKAARKRYLELNPESTFVLYNHKVLVASFDFTPVTHNAVLEFREGRRGWTFPDEWVLKPEPGRPLEFIVIDFMTTTNAPLSRREYYAQTLLRNFGTKILPEYGRRGIEIVSIDACGGTELGKRILTTAGFTSLGVKQIQKAEREIFTLNVQESNLRALRPYKEALLALK